MAGQLLSYCVAHLGDEPGHGAWITCSPGHAGITHQPLGLLPGHQPPAVNFGHLLAAQLGGEALRYRSIGTAKAMAAGSIGGGALADQRQILTGDRPAVAVAVVVRQQAVDQAVAVGHHAGVVAGQAVAAGAAEAEIALEGVALVAHGATEHPLTVVR